MVDHLIAHGATVRLPAAIAIGQMETIGRLLRRDPNCLHPGNTWGALIIRAAERASGEVVAMLLQMGASANVSDNPATSVGGVRGYTPLHAAAFHGNLAAVKVLLDCGANVRTRDSRYLSTPAGWAASARHENLADLILQEAIDPFEAIEMDRAPLLPGILAADPAALNRTLCRIPRLRGKLGAFVPLRPSSQRPPYSPAVRRSRR